MSFTEKVKFEIKKKALQRCCICHNVGIEIHHIIPWTENGSDTINNGAPLCPSCHETYGQNPSKRKFIKEARDIWFEICAEKITPNKKKLDNIEKILRDVKSILDCHIDNKIITNPANEFLSFGQIIDYYNQFEIEDEQGLEVCYSLIFSTTGDVNDNGDKEFNDFRDEFLKTFGEFISKKIVTYSMITNKINWNESVPGYKLTEFLKLCYVSMLFLFMNFDLSFDKEAIGARWDENKTDLIFQLITHNKV